MIISHHNKDFLAWRFRLDQTVEIEDIAVGSERRKGVGRRMFQELLREMPQQVKLVWAITRENNFIAQQFYEALGFRVVAVLRNFYQENRENHVDAVMYGYDTIRG